MRPTYQTVYISATYALTLIYTFHKTDCEYTTKHYRNTMYTHMAILIYAKAPSDVGIYIFGTTITTNTT
jgi:hypothetical protein